MAPPLPQVDELLDDAAGFIGVMDELTPLDRAAYNPLWEVWTRVARIPPEERHRCGARRDAGSVGQQGVQVAFAFRLRATWTYQMPGIKRHTQPD